MAPTTLADGSALRKTWRALPTRKEFLPSVVQRPLWPASLRRSFNRNMLLSSWGM